MSQDISTLRRQLAQLKELHDAGVLPMAQYEESKAPLERQVIDLVVNGANGVDPVPPNAAPAPVGVAGGPASTPVASAPSGPSLRLMAVLAGVVVAVAAAGYWWMGAPDQIAAGPAPAGPMAQGAADPKAAPHPTSQSEIAGMADKLAARMKDTPDDAEGWAMLARSYTVLERHPEALVAYEKAVKLRKDDASLLADYADSLAVKNGRSLAGEPMKWVEAALKVDPRDPKALALAGTHAFNLKNYKDAVKYWEQVVQYGQADSSYVQQVRSGLVEARELGGIPAPALAASAAPAAAGPMALPGSSVSGTVSLAPAMAKLVGPEDTVFIYARAAEGGMKMPLAIQRKQVKDLPITFTLDDSTSMSPAARISGVKSVVVSARVSKSGQATPQPGDISGQSEAVSVGTSGIKLELQELVK
jgi:cytochrome c-type biogenesis protein CcmH